MIRKNIIRNNGNTEKEEVMRWNFMWEMLLK